jgi:hypothetical protein
VLQGRAATAAEARPRAVLGLARRTKHPCDNISRGGRRREDALPCVCDDCRLRVALRRSGRRRTKGEGAWP